MDRKQRMRAATRLIPRYLFIAFWSLVIAPAIAWCTFILFFDPIGFDSEVSLYDRDNTLIIFVLSCAAAAFLLGVLRQLPGTTRSPRNRPMPELIVESDEDDQKDELIDCSCDTPPDFVMQVPNICAICGYDLRGADHVICPECGTDVEYGSHGIVA